MMGSYSSLFLTILLCHSFYSVLDCCIVFIRLYCVFLPVTLGLHVVFVWSNLVSYQGCSIFLYLFWIDSYHHIYLLQRFVSCQIYIFHACTRDCEVVCFKAFFLFMFSKHYLVHNKWSFYVLPVFFM